MSVISISRDTQNNVSIVRIIAGNTAAEVLTADYIANEMPNIRALNSGFWQWYTTDMLCISCSDQNIFATFTNDTFASLMEYSGGSSGVIEPGSNNDFAIYDGNGNTLMGVNAATARTLLSLGSMALQAANAVDITGGTASLSEVTFPFTYDHVVSDINLVPADSNVFFDVTSAPTNISDALGLASFENGYQFIIKNNSSSTVTFTPKSGETVDGNSSLSITAQQAVLVAKTPTEWATVANNFGAGGGGVTASQVQQAAFNLVVDTGTADDYVGSISPDPGFPLPNGLQVDLLIASGNTNLTFLPFFTITATSGSHRAAIIPPANLTNAFLTVVPGDLLSGTIVKLIFNSSQNAWLIQNPANSVAADANASLGYFNSVADIGAVNAYAGLSKMYQGTNNFAAAQGTYVNLFVANTNTGASTFAWDGLSPTIITYNGSALVGGEMIAGQNSLLVYDGSGAWQLINNRIFDGTSVTPQQVQQAAFNVGVDTGIADAYIVNLSPVVTSLTDGLLVAFTPANINTIATPTLQINSNTPVTIVLPDLTSIAPGDLSNSTAYLIYSATLNLFILFNPRVSYVSAYDIQLQKFNYTIDSGTPNAITLVLTPAIVSNSTVYAVFQCSNNNTGATTIDVGFGALPLVTNFNNALVGGELIAGATYIAVFNFTSNNYVLINPSILHSSQILGTQTNDNAPAGFVGEYFSTIVPLGSAISLTTATPTDIAVLPLPDGDFDVWGELYINGTSGAVVVGIQGAISTTSATFPTVPADDASLTNTGTINDTIGTNNLPTVVLNPCRQSLASPTNIYLVGQCEFSVQPVVMFGIICARRVR